jgi:hypothetical protein
MDVIITQIKPQNKLEEITSWFLYFVGQEGIVKYQTIDDDDTLEIKQEIMKKFQKMKQTEDMKVILEEQMEDLQTHAEELLVQKDMD